MAWNGIPWSGEACLFRLPVVCRWANGQPLYLSLSSCLQVNRAAFPDSHAPSAPLLTVTILTQTVSLYDIFFSATVISRALWHFWALFTSSRGLRFQCYSRPFELSSVDIYISALVRLIFWASTQKM